jgi:hypothetical protein
MKRTIDIRPGKSDGPLIFAVTVREGDSASHHEVTMSSSAFAKTGKAPEQVIDAAFRFLLDRESKDSILARFDLSTIQRYFPEFERTLSEYLE